MTSLASMKGPSVTLPSLTTAPPGFRPSPGMTSFSNFVLQAVHAAYCARISSGDEGFGEAPAGKRYRYRNLVLVADMCSSGFGPAGRSAGSHTEDARACRDWTRRREDFFLGPVPEPSR